MKSKIIYLASPYGFSSQWKIKLLPEFVSILESMGAIVWDPFNRQGDNDFAQKGCAYNVASSNFDDLKRADAIFAILNGCPPDEGVMIELGISIALGKPTFLFRDDFRKCTDSDEFPLNLMTFLGLPYDSWEDYYYRSINEIGNPSKAIFRWLNN